MRISPRYLAALLAVSAVALAGMISVGPLVRSRVASAAAARRLDVELAHVSLGWFSITLDDVRVRPSAVAGIEAVFPRIRVELSVSLSPASIQAESGEIEMRGTGAELEEQIRAWRSSANSSEVEHARARLPLSLRHLEIRWVEREGQRPAVQIHGGALSRSEDGWEARADDVRAALGSARLEVEQAKLGADTHGALTQVAVERASIGLTSRAKEAEHRPSSGGDESPVPPPIVQGTSSSAPGSPAGITSKEPVTSLRLPLPDLHLLRARIVAVGALLSDRIIDGAQVDVQSLGLSVGTEQRPLVIGKGPLRVSRVGQTLEVTFTSGVQTDGTPLSVKASLPLKSGDTVASFMGGPISLARLGADEGAAGLVAVDRTTVSGRGKVSLAASGDSLTFEGDIAARGLSIDEPRIARETVRGLDVTAIVRGALDDQGSVRLDDAEVGLGALRWIAHGSAEQTAEQLTTSLSLELPSTPCELLLRSIPSAIVPTLDGAEMTGALGAHGQIAFDSRSLDNLIFDWKIDNRCAMSAIPEELAKDRFAQPFEHWIYQPDGTIEQETTGPTSDNWTDLAHISPFMQVAVLTTEDGAFYKHHGFNRAAMRNALVADLKAGRFVRGASTITMQLAKNLFLSRDKTLSRKLEEVILADYLESSFTKEEMIELYLNVIEFGPGLYGITHAAERYFGRPASQLNLAECLFLSSILPSPIRYGKLADKPQLSDSWSKHLRDLMGVAAKLGTISDGELAEGLKEQVVFHDRKEPPPPPRPPVSGTHFQLTHERVNADWEETPAAAP